MSKKIYVILLILICALTIGCAGAPEPAPEPTPRQEPAQTPQPVVVTPAPEPAPVVAAPEPEPQPVVVTPPPPVVVTPPPPAAVTPPPAQEELILQGASRHNIIWRDSLSQIAARVYGAENMYYFPLIRLANANVVSDPDMIMPDVVLVIPDLQANLNDPGARALLKTEMLSMVVHYQRRNMLRAAAEIRNLADRL